jgi:hypothetical protein
LRDRGFEVDAGVLSAEVRNLPDRALDPRPHAPVLRKTCCGCTRTELVEYVAAQHRALAPDDRRRRICERCLDERCGRATPGEGPGPRLHGNCSNDEAESIRLHFWAVWLDDKAETAP